MATVSLERKTLLVRATKVLVWAQTIAQMLEHSISRIYGTNPVATKYSRSLYLCQED